MDTDEHRWIENSDKGWLGHSEAVPQMAEDWGFATLSHQPPTKLLLLYAFSIECSLVKSANPLQHNK